MGIAMEARTDLGETPGGLQAPHVVKEGGTYHMFYGDWERICLARSEDGKLFERVQVKDGQPDALLGALREQPRSDGSQNSRYLLLLLHGP